MHAPHLPLSNIHVSLSRIYPPPTTHHLTNLDHVLFGRNFRKQSLNCTVMQIIAIHELLDLLTHYHFFSTFTSHSVDMIFFFYTESYSVLTPTWAVVFLCALLDFFLPFYIFRCFDLRSCWILYSVNLTNAMFTVLQHNLRYAAVHRVLCVPIVKTLQVPLLSRFPQYALRYSPEN